MKQNFRKSGMDEWRRLESVGNWKAEGISLAWNMQYRLAHGGTGRGAKSGFGKGMLSDTIASSEGEEKRET